MTGIAQTDFSALLNKGVAEANSGNISQAIAIFQQVRQFDPANETAVLWEAYLVEDVYTAAAILEDWDRKYPGSQHVPAYLQQARLRCNEVETLLMNSVTYSHINTAYQKGAKATSSVPRLGELLLQEGVLTTPQLDTVIKRYQDLQARGFSHRIGQVMVEMGYITFKQLDQWLDRQSGDFSYRFQD